MFTVPVLPSDLEGNPSVAGLHWVVAGLTHFIPLSKSPDRQGRPSLPCRSPADDTPRAHVPDRDGAQQAAEATVFPAYDIETDEEIPVAVAPGAQQWPAIHGDMVVWADNRNSPVMGTRIAGCHNCPDNRFDIYSYDLTTGEERPLV